MTQRGEVARLLADAAAVLGGSANPFNRAVGDWLTSEARRAGLLARCDQETARSLLGETLEDKYLKHAIEVARTVVGGS